jgi:hypothetical protein
MPKGKLTPEGEVIAAYGAAPWEVDWLWGQRLS